jgi:hypothetical protein
MRMLREHDEQVTAAELAKLDPAGWRPLRPAAPDQSLFP